MRTLTIRSNRTRLLALDYISRRSLRYSRPSKTPTPVTRNANQHPSIPPSHTSNTSHIPKGQSSQQPTHRTTNIDTSVPHITKSIPQSHPKPKAPSPPDTNSAVSQSDQQQAKSQEAHNYRDQPHTQNSHTPAGISHGPRVDT